MSISIKDEYLVMLREWAEAMKPYLFTPVDRPDLTYFGDGSNGWGVQTNQKAFSAYAVLSALPGGEEKWRESALAMLRYSLETHIVGSYHLTNGPTERWGHTWISALGVERMMYGVDALWDSMTENDHRMLREMLISESDWILNEYPLTAGLTKDNKPESNMWNGAVMLRTASLYPDAPNADAYIRRGADFLVNAISMPSTETDPRVYEGKSAAERFVGANFFESGGCSHHGYQNVGYMVITLSNAAMLHFHYRSRGLKAPAVLYHNWDRVWKLVRSLICDDGRLLRIGGDTRVRYCYCQDYLLQTLNMAADCLGEDTEKWERGWIEILKKERKENGDGTFLSRRAEIFVEKSPLYYTRLESDRACCIAFSAWYRHQFADFASPAGMGDYQWDEDAKTSYTQWTDEYHGSFFVHDRGRYAAFTWRGGEGPMALCVPPSDSSLAEWRNNMTSQVYGDGSTDYAKVLDFGGKMLDGGFVTWGAYIGHTEGLLEESRAEADTAEIRIACAALPDGVTMLTLQRAFVRQTTHLGRVYGLNLQIPNDMFNGYSRRYDRCDGRITVDNALSVVPLYGGELELVRPPYRQIGLREDARRKWIYRDRGFLHTDMICMAVRERPAWFACGETVFDIGAAVFCESGFSGGRHTEMLAFPEYPDLRGVRVQGADNRMYTFAANFGEEEITLTLPGAKTPVTLASGAAELLM